MYKMPSSEQKILGGNSPADGPGKILQLQSNEMFGKYEWPNPILSLWW